MIHTNRLVTFPTMGAAVQSGPRVGSDTMRYVAGLTHGHSDGDTDVLRDHAETEEHDPCAQKDGDHHRGPTLHCDAIGGAPDEEETCKHEPCHRETDTTQAYEP